MSTTKHHEMWRVGGIGTSVSPVRKSSKIVSQRVKDRFHNLKFSLSDLVHIEVGACCEGNSPRFTKLNRNYWLIKFQSITSQLFFYVINKEYELVRFKILSD